MTLDARNSLGSLFCDCEVFCLLQMYYQTFPILPLWKGCVLNKFIPIINAYTTVPIGIVDRAGLTVIFNQPLVN